MAILTASERVSRGEGRDESGEVIADLVTAEGAVVCERVVVPDDRGIIRNHLMRLADGGTVDVILTTGGSGIAPRDVTPEATLDVVERLIPGIPEAARVKTLEKTSMAMLSRSVAGVRGQALIINLPGSPKGVREWLEVILPVLPHAVSLVRGEVFPWGKSHEGA
ncbi:MAG: MogA/MoaB family molybdenum cofactor biosynthesis protein [Armatimonadota bacterium]|nr:MogA/MoaB family molybdenum cofactor biosynthesis protein [Armatimonadota bacterium]MDR5703102.1 MogA/MoaB family molybdenum cofactor biosynthesis protein [Armatimonadota bacterium]MDR7434977.1 MogA/MoaB family molybdenum cofactor biosynthesis protein [Armatimonadota bacterium]